jgi:two-component system KDP operon response regulator KdpE
MTTDKRILFIDDDVETLALLEKLLGLEGYKVFLATNGPEGLHLAYEQHPDLIILDVTMPGQDGFEVCKSLREITTVPILMLTARSAASDMKRGFAVGADDYFKKPFSNDELLLRVKALLRRGKNVNIDNVEIKNYSDDVLKVDLIEHTCYIRGNPVSLTTTEFNLLSILVQHPSQTLSIRTLLTEVWGDAYSLDKGLPSLYIHQLRKKLQDDNAEHKYIQTQWGRGYYFNPMPQAEKPVITHNFDRRSTDKVKSASPQIYKWKWILLIILLLILALLIGGNFGVFARPIRGGTSLETLIAAEGFIEKDITGARGHICVTNTGKYPTENLSVVNGIQLIGQKQGDTISTTLNLNEKPVLDPGESYCYPYMVTFEVIFDKDVKYKSLASITITNYVGLMPGSDHCPGTDPCSFGPNAVTDFNMPRP